MAKVTVGLPQGTRDFGPAIVRKRNYILATIRNVFESYGFQPLETPAMENLETLMGKYGDEGDKLIFKILNNGLNDPKNIEKARTAFENVLGGKNDKNLTERALRYDLTIPFARYVAMNHAQLNFPFRRYQIQPVWRADRPQKGRYREFYQCDADIVGSKSLLNETELAILYAKVFSNLGLPVEIKLNNRKILAALASLCGGAGKMTDITIAIDKLDKIGIEKVKEELSNRGLNPEQVGLIEKYLSIAVPGQDYSGNEKIIADLKLFFANNEGGNQGIEEISFILNKANQYCDQSLVVDPTLARGLNYYTGTIFEVKAKNVLMGSIGGGGRYDDLTGSFGVPNIPGVGISFGVDRIYDVLEELQKFPEDVHGNTKVLFCNFGKEEADIAFSLMQQLREKGISCEIYPDEIGVEKQLKYADKKSIPYAVIIGNRELSQGICVVKDLKKWGQRELPLNELIAYTFS